MLVEIPWTVGVQADVVGGKARSAIGEIVNIGAAADTQLVA